MAHKPEKYHPQWKDISRQIKEQAEWKCEGTTRFPNCEAKHGEEHPETGSKVILTVAHMDHTTTNDDPSNLRALCQRCHLDWDRADNAVKAEKTRKKKQYGDHKAQYKMMLQYSIFK